MSFFSLHPLRQQSDEQLMLRVGTGSDAAFEELYRRYARRLQGFFFRQLGGDEEAAADATHDTFLRLFEARDRYVEGRDFATWLFTIAYNLCRNRYRTNAYAADYLATLDAEPISTENTEIEMDRETLKSALANVLDNLPPPSPSATRKNSVCRRLPPCSISPKAPSRAVCIRRCRLFARGYFSLKFKV